jgi:hypothetical protein
MRRRKLVVLSVVVILGIAGTVAGLALYKSFSARASAPGFSEALSSIPSDCQFVFGINVQKFVTSPAYAKFRQKQSQPIGKDLAEFIEKTGVDPARDVSYLVGAGSSREKLKGAGAAIIVGNFNKDTITAYIRSKTTPVEREYGGVSILMSPEPKSDNPEKGLAFLSDREIVLGDMESIKSILDVRGKGNKSILLNPAMAPLLDSVNPDEMFWFAGDAASALANAPVTTPLAANASSIRGIVGTLNINDTVVGKITATAIDADSATKLVDVVKGFVALGQLAGDRNPDLKLLLSGLTVAQNASQISVGLSFPLDLLDKLERTRSKPDPAKAATN